MAGTIIGAGITIEGEITSEEEVVVAGKRIQLGTKEDLKVPVGEWHVLKSKMVGDHIECYLDGKKLLDAHDSTYLSGKIGIWTQADTVAAFDDLFVASM